MAESWARDADEPAVNFASWTVGAVVTSCSSELPGYEAFNLLDAHPRLCGAPSALPNG